MYGYLNLKLGAAHRLLILKRHFEKFLKDNPNWQGSVKSWRDMRYSTFRSQSSLDQGLHNDKPIWYTQSGAYFDRERFADEVPGSFLRHTGWFCDIDQDEKCRGIVVSLPHGKFLSGYHMSGNDERVYFPDIFDDITDAANNADEEARLTAEAESEDNGRRNEAEKLKGEIEEIEHRIKELEVLMRDPDFGESATEEMEEKMEELADKMKELADEYADID